ADEGLQEARAQDGHGLLPADLAAESAPGVEAGGAAEALLVPEPAVDQAGVEHRGPGGGVCAGGGAGPNYRAVAPAARTTRAAGAAPCCSGRRGRTGRTRPKRRAGG